MPIVRAGPSGNAWRTARATQLGVVVDGDAYFRAVHHALCRARHQILILGWDFDSRVCLRRDLDHEGRRSATLGPLLRRLAQRPHGPECYVLSWDFALFYALEREALTALKLAVPALPRLHVQLDDMHPVGASHHQKVVVVDDAVAFCGGFDLCGARWDTPAHSAHVPARHDPPLPPHDPFHDVQMAVAGPVAAVLGQLARERWFRATGHRPRPPDPNDDELLTGRWPSHLAAQFTDVEVAVARTEPGFNGRHEVREVEQLHLDAIAAAQRHIYIENQYFTSGSIAAALARRLQEPDGPDVVLVGPRECSGWAETSTMGVLRRRLVHDLRRADTHRRLRLYHPTVARSTQRLNVHSKVTIIDDVLLRVGSANLSNRSMGLDTECDLAVEATSIAQQETIARVRAALLAEHLDVESVTVHAATMEHGLIGAVERLRRTAPSTHEDDGPRTLAPLDVDVYPVLEPLASASSLIDPVGVLSLDPTVNRELPAAPPTQRLRCAALSAALGALLAAAVLAPVVVAAALLAPNAHAPLEDVGSWIHATSARTDWGAVRCDLLSCDVARPWGLGAWGVALGVLAVVVGGLLGVPVVMLHGVALWLGGQLWGAIVVPLGVAGAAAATWVAGRVLGERWAMVVMGDAPFAAARGLRRRGITAVAALHLRPATPSFSISLAAGAAGLPLVAALGGALLGLAPILVATALLVGVCRMTLAEPSPSSVGLSLVVTAGVGASLWSLQRWIRRRQLGAPPLALLGGHTAQERGSPQAATQSPCISPRNADKGVGPAQQSR